MDTVAGYQQWQDYSAPAVTMLQPSMHANLSDKLERKSPGRRILALPPVLRSIPNFALLSRRHSVFTARPLQPLLDPPSAETH